MSFILDALRKSESRRQAGRPPGLNDGPEAPAPGPRANSRRWRGLIAAGVVAVLAVSAAIVLVGPDLLERDDTLASSEPAGGPEQTPVVAIDADALESGREPDTPASGTEEAAGAPPEPIPDESEEEQEEQTDEEAETGDGQRRVRRAPPERSETRQAPQRERTVTDSEQAAAEIERELARTREQVEEAEPESPADADDHDETEDDQPWREQAGEYVRAWELPLSVRRELPELELTIHVFSPEEETRFVLINGERYRPGDQLTPDARLVDICREGAIVDFREHRFLLEP